jgi:hypothetical protein
METGKELCKADFPVIGVEAAAAEASGTQEVARGR